MCCLLQDWSATSCRHRCRCGCGAVQRCTFAGWEVRLSWRAPTGVRCACWCLGAPSCNPISPGGHDIHMRHRTTTWRAEERLRACVLPLDWQSALTRDQQATWLSSILLAPDPLTHAAISGLFTQLLQPQHGGMRGGQEVAGQRCEMLGRGFGGRRIVRSSGRGCAVRCKRGSAVMSQGRGGA